MIDPRDEAVFDQFSRVTGIPYPASIERFLPEGGLFTDVRGKFFPILGVVVILALGWWGAKRQAEMEQEEEEHRKYSEWRSSHV